MSHGITTEKTEDGVYTTFANDYLPASFDSLSFDFRGHGDSALLPIDVTISGEILDLMAVLGWAQTKNYRSIHILATSFAASITLLSISVYDLHYVRSVVFWNPVISYWNTFIKPKVDWGKEFFDQETLNELSLREYTEIPDEDFRISSRMTQELLLFCPEKTRWPESIPLFIIHGTSDTLVPFSDANEYYQTHRTKEMKFLALDGVDHGFDDKITTAMKTTAEWILQQTPE